jgi:hypothetical protein
MTIKLITYTKSFYPYVYQFKNLVVIGVFLVFRDGKFLKRGFGEITGYTKEQLAEFDTLAAGLSWITRNVPLPDTECETLNVIFCGGSRTSMKKNMERGAISDIYRYDDIMTEIVKAKYGSVSYSAQGKIIDDDPVYDLFGFATKVFEMFYGKDNGYTHPVYEEIKNGEKTKMMMVGDPEIRQRTKTMDTEWH